MEGKEEHTNVEDNFIPEYIYEICITEVWKIFAISFRVEELLNVEGKEEHDFFPNRTEIFHKQKCGREFNIGIHFWNLFNWKLEMYQTKSNCDLLSSWKRFYYKYQDFHKPILKYGRYKHV